MLLVQDGEYILNDNLTRASLSAYLSEHVVLMARIIVVLNEKHL